MSKRNSPLPIIMRPARLISSKRILPRRHYHVLGRALLDLLNIIVSTIIVGFPLVAMLETSQIRGICSYTSDHKKSCVLMRSPSDALKRALGYGSPLEFGILQVLHLLPTQNVMSSLDEGMISSARDSGDPSAVQKAPLPPDFSVLMVQDSGFGGCHSNIASCILFMGPLAVTMSYTLASRV